MKKAETSEPWDPRTQRISVRFLRFRTCDFGLFDLFLTNVMQWMQMPPNDEFCCIWMIAKNPLIRN